MPRHLFSHFLHFFLNLKSLYRGMPPLNFLLIYPNTHVHSCRKNVPVLEDLMEKSKCLPVIKSGKHFQIVMICANWALDCVLNSVQMLSQFIVTIAPLYRLEYNCLTISWEEAEDISVQICSIRKGQLPNHCALLSSSPCPGPTA